MTIRRTAAAAILFSLGLLAAGLPGCSGNRAGDAAQPTATPTATAVVKQPNRGAGMAQVRLPPPGVKTGDFSGGRK